MDKNILDVVNNNLCTGCGTCISLCHNEAIELATSSAKGIYYPKIVKEKCLSCGICLKVCPGYVIDFKDLNNKIFGKQPTNNLIGNYTNLYIGHSTDYDIRYNSASGGLITQLLIFALEAGIIDGALVTKMKSESPFEPEPFIARTREEIIQASKSKYCPVPLNIMLKKILQTEGKYAIVGLPCHIHGIRKAETFNKILRERIVLHLGLLCSTNHNFLGTEYILRRFGVKKEDVVKFDYRGEGWIGGMTILKKNGDKIFSPLPVYYSGLLRSFFIPTRCTFCNDQTSELADISFGDIWLPEFQKDKIGTSLLILRNNLCKDFISSAIFKKNIELTNVELENVLESQKHPLYFKKTSLSLRIFLFNIFGKDTPLYQNQELKNHDLYAYLHTIIMYFEMYISSKRFLWPLLPIVVYFVNIGNNLVTHSQKKVTKSKDMQLKKN